MCRAYVHLGEARKGEQWCDALLAKAAKRRDGEGEEPEVDAMVCKGEAALARSEWEEGVRWLERAWEAGGRTNGDVSQRNVWSFFGPNENCCGTGLESAAEGPEIVETVKAKGLL